MYNQAKWDPRLLSHHLCLPPCPASLLSLSLPELLRICWSHNPWGHFLSESATAMWATPFPTSKAMGEVRPRLQGEGTMGKIRPRLLEDGQDHLMHEGSAQSAACLYPAVMEHWGRLETRLSTGQDLRVVPASLHPSPSN